MLPKEDVNEEEQMAAECCLQFFALRILFVSTLAIILPFNELNELQPTRTSLRQPKSTSRNQNRIPQGWK
jgi:hypothetical protein